MTEPQCFSKQVSTVIGGEPHRVCLLRVLLHRDCELVASWRFHRRNNANELLIRPLCQTHSSELPEHTLNPFYSQYTGVSQHFQTLRYGGFWVQSFTICMPLLITTRAFAFYGSRHQGSQ